MPANLLNPKPAVPALALRPRDAAKALAVSERTLWDWTKQGKVPHVRLGGTVLYPVEALQRWLEQRAKTADQHAEGGRP